MKHIPEIIKEYFGYFVLFFVFGVFVGINILGFGFDVTTCKILAIIMDSLTLAIISICLGNR